MERVDKTKQDEGFPSLDLHKMTVAPHLCKVIAAVLLFC
jgi:hypothetical protein